MVDLKQAIDATKGEMGSIKMEGTTHPVANASSSLQSGKQAGQQ